MPYNLLMPEEKQESLRPSWVPLRLWQLRWWIVGTLFLLVWWRVPPLLYSHSGGGTDAKNAQLKAITDTRTALLAGLIGVGALLTFWLNSRVYRITARTFEVTEQGHITERYTKAIEQLGSGTLTVRLGGIYALERLAHDSPERDQPTVVEVLGAFVREHSRGHDTPPPKQGMAEEAAEKPDATAPGTDAKPRPATDVQAALSVLGRLPQQPKVSRGDLTGAQLAGANLSGAQLAGADLSGAQLAGANLSGAQLADAYLSRAQLEEADLSGAQLVGATLTRAWLVKADLSGAGLFHADLSGTQLDEANLSAARLEGANLSGAQLYKANLHQAQALTQPQLDVAVGDRLTELPAGLGRPASWVPVGPPHRISPV
jgi:Pentapeptide repeats (8 copies)